MIKKGEPNMMKNMTLKKGKKKHDSQKGEPKPRRVASSGLLPTISSFVIEQAKNPIEVTHSICME